MKELKRTQRITIAGFVFFAAILLAMLFYPKPKVKYELSPTETNKLLAAETEMVSVKEIVGKETGLPFVLIDIRNQFEFEKGAIDGSINMYRADIFEPYNIKYFNKMKDEGQQLVLYGRDVNEAGTTWLMLRQMGFDNIKYLKEGYSDYLSLKEDSNYRLPLLDKSKYNIQEFIAKTQENASKNGVTIIKKPKEQVRIIKKKKKRKAEGGC